MEFMLPPHLREDVTVNDLPFPHDDHALVAMTEARITSGPFGTLLHQKEIGKHYSFIHHHLRIRHPTPLQLVAHEPVAVLTYLLKGALPCMLNGLAEPPLEESTYHLYYIPAGTYDFHMPEGEYTLFQVLLETEDVDWIAERCDDMFDVQTRLEDALPEGIRQRSFTISKRIRQHIEDLRKCRLQDLERDAAIDHCLLWLQEEYIKGITEKKKKGAYRVDDVREDVIEQIKAALREPHKPKGFWKAFALTVGLHYRKVLFIIHLITGHGAREDDRHQKMEKACYLLKETNLAIQDVALEMGVEDQGFFSRKFKRAMKCTPTEYREKYRDPQAAPVLKN